MKAILQHYRQSPRKVRLVARAVRGKSVVKAMNELAFLNKEASLAIRKLINSATANAKENFNIDKDDLVIESIVVNKGMVLKRFMPRARGRATPIRKRTSHITLHLKSTGVSVKKAGTSKKEKKVSTTKSSAKKQ